MNISSLRDLHKKALECKKLSQNAPYFDAKNNYIEYSKLAEQIRKYDSLFCLDLCSFEQYAQKYFDERQPSTSTNAFLITESQPYTERQGTDYAGKPLSTFDIPVKYTLMVQNKHSDGVVNNRIPAIICNFSLVTNNNNPTDQITKIQNSANSHEEMQYVKINLLTNPTLHLDSYNSEATDLTKYGVDASDMLWSIVDQHARHLMNCKRASNAEVIDNLEQDNQSLNEFDNIDLAMSK